MATRRGGVGALVTPLERRLQTEVDRLATRSLRRGVISTLPLEALVIGTSCYFAWLDFERPLEAFAVAVQAADAAFGAVQVALYRARADDIKANSWTARLMSVATQAGLTGTMTEYAIELPSTGAARRAVLDTTEDAFLVAVRGSTATVTVRGTSGYTAPAFGGRLLANAVLPQEVTLEGTAATNIVPSVALLTPTGARLR